MRYLRLLAPPLQLLSATIWQVVQQGLVDHYGMLEEFVTMVTELVPELMSYSQRAQLILGLRARLVLEMCRGDGPVDINAIQPHLEKIKAPVTTAKDHRETINRVEESEVNFVELVHSLLEDPSKRNYFFKEVFPAHFGPKYDTALEMLVWEFITRLEELLPVPDFTQLAALLSDAPCLLEDCLQSFFPPEDIKAVVEHHRNLGLFDKKDSRLLPMDDCILSALSLPPGTKPAANSTLLELKGHSEADNRRASKTEDGHSAANGHSQSSAGGRVLRKRKMNDIVDIPSKQPTKALPHLNSSVDDDNSTESPLISIWGDYTDSSKVSLGSDTKVPWSDEETLILLDIWGMNSMQHAVKDCLKNPHIFTQMSQRLAEQGYRRTVEQCQTRIKQLKKYFEQISSIGGSAKLECKFYDQLEQILSSNPELSCDAEEVDEDDLQEEDDDLQFIAQNMPMDLPLDIPQDIVSSTGRTAWTDPETLALINIWGEDKIQQGLRGGHRTGQMFSIISKRMMVLGYSRTPDQCQSRVKRLKSSYKQCYENNLKNGVQVECKFYNELARILERDHSIDDEVDKALEELKDEDLSTYFHQDLDAFFGVQDERKKVPWSDKETIILLEIWGHPQVQQNLKRFPHNSHLFSEISEKLAACGYRRSAEQCYTRLKRLKAAYRQRQESMRSGSDKGTDKLDIRFYNMLEQILDTQPSTSSSKVMDTIEISEDSNSNSVPETDGETTSTETGLWSDEEVRTLIDIWAEEEIKKSLRGDLHNGEVYANISEKMVALGYSKTSEQCCFKVKALRSAFRQCCDRKKAGKKVEYRFYNQLEQIFGPVLIDEPDEKDEEAEKDPVVADNVNTVWTDDEVQAVIEIWAANDVQQILKACSRNGRIYVDISERMAVLGYQKTADQCHDQITKLKKAYRRYCNNRRGGSRRTTFRYFNIMAPVLGGFGFADVDPTSFDSNPEAFMDKDLDGYEQPSTSQLLSDQSRKTPWSDQETRLLLKIWGEDRIQLSLKGSMKNRHVYEYISTKMSDYGYIRNSEQCYTRIKRLKSGFQHEKEDFRYYMEMEEILKKELKADSTFEDAPLTDMCFTDMCLVDDPDDGTLLMSTNKGMWSPDGSKVIWGDKETKVLLDIWGSEDIQVNLKSNTKNKHIFDQVSKAMVSQGYMRTADQCQSRVKRLRANFRGFVEGKKGDKQECKFFDHMVRAFGNKYMNSCPPAEDGADDSVQEFGSEPLAQA